MLSIINHFKNLFYKNNSAINSEQLSDDIIRNILSHLDNFNDLKRVRYCSKRFEAISNRLIIDLTSRFFKELHGDNYEPITDVRKAIILFENFIA